MGFISSIGKGVLRSINDKHADNQHEKAKDVAYEKVGKRMRNAKKKGYRIDGSKAYRQELRKEHNRINVNHKRREDMINDL